MTSRRIIALAWCAAVFDLIGAADARAVDYLAGEKLRATLTAQHLDFLPRNGKPYRFTFTDNGSYFEYIFRDEKDILANSVGKWWIEEDTLVCRQDNRPNREKVCLKYAIQDGILKQYTASGVLTPDYMVTTHKQPTTPNPARATP